MVNCDFISAFLLHPHGSPATSVFIPAGYSLNPRGPCHPIRLKLSTRYRGRDDWCRAGDGMSCTWFFFPQTVSGRERRVQDVTRGD